MVNTSLLYVIQIAVFSQYKDCPPDTLLPETVDSQAQNLLTEGDHENEEIILV